MRHFTTTELARMQLTQDDAMQDKCTHLVYTIVTNKYGLPSESWVEGDTLICGLDIMVKPEAMGESDVPMLDAKLRLPLNSFISAQDRIEITHRFGVQLDISEKYEIVSNPDRGPSGLVLDLIKVTEYA
jgi:hypothetical protein